MTRMRRKRSLVNLAQAAQIDPCSVHSSSTPTNRLSPQCPPRLTGLSIWKPVQLAWLARLFGGYPIARQIHLPMMFCIIAFLALHLLLVAIYPKTLVSMIASTKAEEER